MGLKASVRNALVNALVNQTDYTAPTSVYVSLHTGDPGDTGANEVSGGSYARANATSSFPAASSGSSANDVAIQYTTASGSWSTVSHCGLWDAVTTGNFLGGGSLSSSKAIASGDTASFAIGNLTVSIT